MSSDYNFTVTSCFLGNVRVKPYFNTQCPPPPPKSEYAIYGWYHSKIISVKRHSVKLQPQLKIIMYSLSSSAVASESYKENYKIHIFKKKLLKYQYLITKIRN